MRRRSRLASRPRSAGVLAAAAAAGLVACSSTDSGTLKLVTGEETDTFSQAPAPITLTVYAWTSSTAVTTIATASLPTGDIDLGTQNESAVATLQIKGNDASGVNVVAGASLALQYGALSGSTLPVFVQRTSEWARLPNPPTDARQSPTLAIVSGEFLFIGGGSGSTSAGETAQLYDFAQLASVSAPPTLPFAPLSLPVIGTVALALGQDTAAYYDFSQGITAAVTPPAGHTWSEVSGGQVVYDYDPSSGTLDAVFVVGATRTQGPATATVLAIDATDSSNQSYLTGNLKWLTLTQPRLGATAAWVAGRGLVVTAGSASAAGVEVIGPGGTSGSALPFPPDASMGAGAALATADTQHLLVAGGITPTGQDAGVRVLDLGCAQSCGTTGTTVWGAGLPVALTSASAFYFASGSAYPAMVVGSELLSGRTHAYLLNSASTGAELATRVPHFGARAIASPLGFNSVLLFGGSDAIESLFPPQP